MAWSQDKSYESVLKLLQYFVAFFALAVLMIFGLFGGFSSLRLGDIYYLFFIVVLAYLARIAVGLFSGIASLRVMRRLWFGNRDTVIHRMTPYTKVYILAWLNMLASSYTRLEFTVPVCLVTLLMITLGEIPREWVKAILGISIVTFPMQLWTSIFWADPRFYHHLPTSITETVIIHVTPSDFAIGPLHFGALGITLGSLYYALTLQIKSITAFMIIFAFVYTISPTQQVQALTQIGAPSPLIFLLMLPYRFLNAMVYQAERVLASQKLRGYSTGSAGRDLVTGARQVAPVLIPLVRSAVIMIDQVTMAAHTRAFGRSKMTPIYNFKIPVHEWIIIAATTVVGGIAMYLLFVYQIGMV